ncbi:MAG: dihydroneopterin aldolase, partial [Prevotella pleuritidis]|nr:dihydroneopterin aldolase [Hoylesella pleuritidis]
MQLESSHIYLRDLRFHAYHGVLPQERVIGNEYVVNVQIDYSVA